MVGIRFSGKITEKCLNLWDLVVVIVVVVVVVVGLIVVFVETLY